MGFFRATLVRLTYIQNGLKAVGGVNTVEGHTETPGDVACDLERVEAIVVEKPVLRQYGKVLQHNRKVKGECGDKDN